MSEDHAVVPDVAELARRLRKEAGHDDVEMGFSGGMLRQAADLIERQAELLDAATKIADRNKQDYDECAAECVALIHDNAQYIERDTQRLAELAALLADAERYRSRFTHCHVAGAPGMVNPNPETCLQCGFDMRDPIHVALAKDAP